MLDTQQFILAPLEGMTDKIFRDSYLSLFSGFDELITPFLPIPDHTVRIPKKSLKDLHIDQPSSIKEVPQLLLSEKKTFLLALKKLEHYGFSEVNWNLGCPSKGVIQKRKGSGLLPHKKQILEVLDYVLPQTNCQISLKVRLGLDSKEEFLRMVDSLNDYPIKEIICHPRVGTQMYSGQVDLSQFGAILSKSKHPVVYNGDIKTYQDYLSLSKRFSGINRWMIGRGILYNPFLIEEIRSVEKKNQSPFEQERFWEFLRVLTDSYQRVIEKEIHLVGRLKGFAFFLFRSLDKKDPQIKQSFFKELKTLSTLKGWNSFLKESEIFLINRL